MAKTPARAVTIAATATSQTFALPAVDGSNVSAVIANAGPAPAFLAFGNFAAPGVPGVMTLQPGTDLLIPTAAASMTSIAAAAAGGSGCTSLTFQRGATATARVFR